jgi:putative FmdB family regulatory protein
VENPGSTFFNRGGIMPIFEFRCQACGHEFEKLVFAGDLQVDCPMCQNTQVEKLMSACAAKVGYKFTAASSKSSCTGCAATSCSTCG